ncbi:Cutinase palindrome-binding protein [Lachnellula suecica]|uniref:Cutinase palindrome-binding protein n=1 Tax=Lachnellula suecica TaxID=602035 RepID=A0A8T9BWQ6_9HELO|nr:Cutinase palindrome-binding protein [Lachnellula suecica]
MSKFSQLDMNNLGMDSMYPGLGSMDGLSASQLLNSLSNQGAANGHDTSMTGMLEEGGMLTDFDGMPMNLDVNNHLDTAGAQKSYAPPNHTMAHNGLEQPEDRVKTPTDNQITMTGAGAGPLPTGFGAQSTLGASGSTLTEFTKRRNWSQKVVEELKDFLHILTPDGRIVYLSPSGKHLTGYPQEELVGKFIVDFIHPDDSGIFVREFNESIASGHPLRFFYRFRKKDGSYTIFESHGHPHLTSEAAQFGPNNAAGFCRGFFMMARPYPTKNAALLDSFLEHKIENERLTKRINDLKQEEAEETEDPHRNWATKLDGRSDKPSEETDTMGGSSLTGSVPAQMSNPDIMAMPPPAKPSSLNAALTRQNLEDANLSTRPDSINDKMARYEGATHIETVEMLTGLKYQDGERSHGISTGDQSPALIKGDAGITIAVDKEARANDKRKKIKLPDEYVCTDCGTLDSPEWRKGPSGPKTLCNACGLRWAKKEKKQKPSPNQAGNGSS